MSGEVVDLLAALQRSVEAAKEARRTAATPHAMSNSEARKRAAEQTPTETPTQRDARIWREGWEAKRHAHPTDMPMCPYGDDQ